MLAKRLGYLYFDTGAMYRAVTLAALRGGLDLTNEAQVSDLAERLQIDVHSPTVQDGRQNTVLADGKDVTAELRSSIVDANVSRVSSYPRVRAALVRQQRAIGERGRVVMIGRDIGTVVLPAAHLKIFLTASEEERARRRYQENLKRGDTLAYEDVLASMKGRDDQDSARTISPLRPADDAVCIDTDHMAAEQVVDALEKLWV